MASALDKLKAKATKEPEKKTSAKGWEIKLTEPETVQSTIEFCAAVHGKKILEGREATARSEFQPILIEAVASEMVKKQCNVENPAVVSPGCNFKFVLAETVNSPALKKALIVDEVLLQNGVNDNLREKLSKEFTKVDGVDVKLDKIQENEPELFDRVVSLLSTANEGGLYNKNGELVAQFTDEEIGKIITSTTRLKLADGLLDRLPAIVAKEPDSKPQMIACLKFLAAIGALQFRITATNTNDPEPVIMRLISGSETETKPDIQSFHTEDGLHIIEVIRDKVLISRVPVRSGEKAVLIKEKMCSDRQHAINTAKVFVKTPVRLREFLVEK